MQLLSKFYKINPFYVFAVSVVTFLVLPFLLQDGMFMDGVQYACVSKNMAHGYGSFWHPVLSSTWDKQGSMFFMEHPPLFYGIESVFFKFLGDSIYTERVFSYVILLLVTLCIHLIWKLCSQSFDYEKSTGWFPILLWIITPTCFWTFQNHMIETLLSLFTLTATLFSLKAVLSNKYSFLYLIISGGFVLASFLTKGFAGLFPLAVIPIFYITTKKISLKAALLYFSVVIFTCGLLLFCIFLFNNNAKECLEFYVTKRLLDRVATTPTINYRLFIMKDLFMEFLPSALICVFIYVYSKRKKHIQEIDKNNKQFFWLMFFIGISASAPIMLTMVQKNFYLVPAIPFFALACAALNTSYISKWQNEILLVHGRTKFLNSVACVIFIAVCVFCYAKYGNVSRDENLLKEVDVIGNYIGTRRVVGCDGDAYFNWGFQFYLIRKYGIELDPRSKRHRFFVGKKLEKQSADFPFVMQPLPIPEYKVYKNANQ